MKRFLIFFAIVEFSCLTSQQIGFGNCPDNLQVLDNFDMSQFTGVWYEQYRYLSASHIGHTCSRVNYTHTDEGALKFSEINFSKWREKYIANSGIVKIEGPEQSKLLIEFFKDNASVMHWILDTDYKSYAAIWSCQNALRGFHLRSVWIYTRQQHPSKEVINKAINVLRRNDISSKLLIKTDQLNCCNCNVEEEPNEPNKNKSKEEIYDLHLDE